MSDCYKKETNSRVEKSLNLKLESWFLPQKHSSGQINLLSSLRTFESFPEFSTENIGSSSVPVSKGSSSAASSDSELSKYFCLSWLLSRVFSWQSPQWQETQIERIRNISLPKSHGSGSPNIKKSRKVTVSVFFQQNTQKSVSWTDHYWESRLCTEV